MRSSNGGSPAHAGMDRIGRRSTRSRTRLPRPRGDGPVPPGMREWALGAPPPTRGWTLSRHRGALTAVGSPAHAGMDRRPATSRSRRRGLPRPRGDGPAVKLLGRSVAVAPPPTRGWTPDPARDLSDLVGSPAHAGMDPSSTAPSPHSGRLPRPRGDGPSNLDWMGLPPKAPPPTRGWTRDAAHVPDLPRGSPAHAGMDPSPAGSGRGRPCSAPGSPAHAGMDR